MEQSQELDLKILLIEVGHRITHFVEGIDPKATMIDKNVTLQFISEVFQNLDQMAEKIGLKDAP